MMIAQANIQNGCYWKITAEDVIAPFVSGFPELKPTRVDYTGCCAKPFHLKGLDSFLGT
jgi:hypothetical protein